MSTSLQLRSESELVQLAKRLASSLKKLVQRSNSDAQVLELIGDVGAGKTTFTRALARALGVKTPVTSPSYTLCNRYTFPLNRTKTEQMSSAELISEKNSPKMPSKTSSTPVFGTLIHYDFYRLDDPGIMSDDLAEALAMPHAIVIIEWGNSVQNLLPADRIKIKFNITGETTRELTLSGAEL